MQHLDPRAKLLFLFQSFISIFLAILLLLGWVLPMLSTFRGGISDTQVETPFMSLGIMVVVITLVVACIVAYLWAHLVYENYKYEVSDIGFKKEEGVIMKKYTTIPYERIQNVDIHRGILSRILGLSDLQIQTAGMSAPAGKYGSMEGRLYGLNAVTAEQLRDELILRSKNPDSHYQKNTL